MIAGLFAVALAGAPTESNLSVSSMGVQYWRSSALAGVECPPNDAECVPKPQDADILLGQRLRWTLVDKEQFQVRLRANARFTLSPNDEAFFERNRVRQLGVSLLKEKWTLDIGRHAVHKGGPRLVDGMQLVAHPSMVFDIGLWGGLAPDLFTTEMRPRFGGGPIIAYSASRVQTSLVGEALFGDGGLDRLAVLAQARVSAARTIDLSGRLDMELASVDGGPHLSDAQVFTRWAPVDAVRLDLFWNAFSSYRYRNTENLDPDIQRFAVRYQGGGQDPRLDAVLQNCLEPKVAQAVGTSFRLLPQTDGVRPLLSLDGRYRFGGREDLQLDGAPVCGFDDINTFVRVNPRIGISQLPIAGLLDVSLDGNFYTVDGKTQYDAGVIVYWEPGDQGVFAFDTSYRLLVNPYDPQANPTGYDGTGHYFDAFVDFVVVPADVTVAPGVNVVSEPAQLVDELGLGAFVRLTKYLRGKRKDRDADPASP